MVRALTLGCTAVLLGCGGGAGTPLLSGQVTGQFDTTNFTATNGFAKDRPGKSSLIILGDGPINCASVEAPDPPTGLNGLISVASLEAGDYANVSVQIFRNVSSFEGRGSNAGRLKLTAVDATKVSGTITYSTTIEAVPLALNGTFEVTRCP